MVACTARQDVTRVPATPSPTVNDPAESPALFFTLDMFSIFAYFLFPCYRMRGATGVGRHITHSHIPPPHRCAAGHVVLHTGGYPVQSL